MCEFVSWIEKNGRVYFLSDYELCTREGMELLRDDPEDILGHGAIRKYFALHGGTDHESTDFSSPDNFPAEIVEAIKGCRFRKFNVTISQVLTTLAWDEYQEIAGAAWAEYKKIEGAALGLSLDLLILLRPGRAEYKKIAGAAFWNLFADPLNRIKEWR